MKVTVNIENRYHDVSVFPTTTFLELKKHLFYIVAEEKNLSEKFFDSFLVRVKIFHKNKICQDQCVISDYGIQNGAHLNVKISRDTHFVDGVKNVLMEFTTKTKVNLEDKLESQGMRLSEVSKQLDTAKKEISRLKKAEKKMKKVEKENKELAQTISDMTITMNQAVMEKYDLLSEKETVVWDLSLLRSMHSSLEGEYKTLKESESDYSKIMEAHLPSTSTSDLLRITEELGAKLAQARKEIDRRYREEKVCKICADKNTSFALFCGHQFCEDCIQRFERCPICKTMVTGSVRLFTE